MAETLDEARFYEALHSTSDDSRATIQNYLRDNLESIDRPMKNIEINDLRYTPLHVAAISNNVEAVRILLRFGASMFLRCASGHTPLQLAFENGAYRAFDEFLTYEQNTSNFRMNIFTSGGLSEFHVACTFKNYDLVEEHINRGADVNIRVDMNAENWAGYTPLHFAARSSTYEIAQLLIHHGANVNARTAQGFTPLHLAPTKCFSTFMVRTLLQYGADINAETNDHQTVAMMAAKRGHWLYLHYLLTNFDVNLELTDENNKNTLLHIVSDSHRPEIVKILLEKGADPNARNQNGRTALHAAVRSGYSPLDPLMSLSQQKDVIELLLRKCNIDARDAEGCTALHYACQETNAEGVSSLLRHGANMDLKDYAGKTATHHFVESGKHNIHLKYLLLQSAEILRICGMRQMAREYDYVNRLLVIRIPEFFENIKKSCMNEIKYMEKIRVDPYTTLYQMLGKTVNEMAHYTTNKTVQKISRANMIEKVLPKYGLIVKRHISNGRLRQPYLMPAVKVFKDITVDDFPNACIYRIFDFCEDSDLAHIIDAANLEN